MWFSDERQMSYLYTQKKFHWDSDEFSKFRTIQTGIYVVGKLVGTYTQKPVVPQNLSIWLIEMILYLQ